MTTLRISLFFILVTNLLFFLSDKDKAIATVKIEEDSSDDDDLEPFSWRSKGAKI